MTLFIYVLREYFKYVIGTVILSLFLFILFDFIQKTGKYFPQYQPRTEDIVKFYLYQVPAQVVQALPIAALLGSVISMIMLSRTNEITAMRAAGMGPIPIAAPLAIGGMLLSLASLFVGEAIVPRFAQKMHYVKKVQIEGDSDEELAEGARWVRSGNNLINFRDYDPIRKVLSGVRLVEVRPNFRPKQSLDATTAIYLPESDMWELADVQMTYFKRNGTLERKEPKGTVVLKLPLSPQKLRMERRKSNELAMTELRDKVDVARPPVPIPSSTGLISI